MNSDDLRLRRYGPKSDDNPTVGQACPACGVDFKPGDWTTLVPLGPGGNPEQRKNAREGRVYKAIATEVHWACATGLEDG